MDECQAEADGERAESCRSELVSRAADDEEEDAGRDDLGYRAGEEAVMLGECSP